MTTALRERLTPVRVISVLVAALAVIASGLIIVPSPASAGDPGVRVTLSLLQGGHVRNYRLFTPATLPLGKPAPLVIVLHSLGHGINEIENTSGFDTLATQKGFAVAYPVGLDQAWNAGICCTLDPSGKMTDTDDVGFLEDVIQSVRGLARIDLKRVYMVGFSNGAMMALRFACERPDLLAGVVSIAGTLETDCNATDPIRLLALRGEKDDTVPFNGTKYSSFAHAPLTSIATSLSTFATINTCKTNRNLANSVAIFKAYRGCRPGGGVDFVTVKRIGHIWPTVANSGYDTSAAIWAFMSAQPVSK